MSVNVLCAGAGWAAQERHLPSLARDPRVRIVGIVDRHPERAADIAARFSIPRWSDSLDEDWGHVDCLTVGAPPWEHGDLVEAALERGWNCLCEKPFVIPAARGADLVELARERALVLATVHNFQFSRAGRRLFELIGAGRLGALESVYGFQLSNPRRRLPPWVGKLPGGLFLDEGPHLVYLTRRILGELEIRTADARLDGSRAIRDISVTFDHDSIWASLTMNFNSAIFEWQLVVVGSQAVAAFDVIRDLLVVVPNDGGHKARDVLRSSRAMVLGHALGFASSGIHFARKRLLYGNDEVFRRFVDAVEGRPERIQGMRGEDGVAAVTCLEAVLARAGLELTPAG